MKDDLKNLRAAMDNTVFKNQKFSKQHKQEVLNQIKLKKKKTEWIPYSLAIAFTLVLFGVGGYWITEELNSSIGGSAAVVSEEPNSHAEFPMENEEIDASVNTYHSFAEETLLEITEELEESLSIPLNLQGLIPNVQSKPLLSAVALEEGYRTQAIFQGEAFDIIFVENVEPPSSIAEDLKNRVQRGEDEKELEIYGHPAFYSDRQKELTIYTEEKYFKVFGAEKEILIKAAEQIELDKPVQSVNLKINELAAILGTEQEEMPVSEIKNTVYLPMDLHKKVHFLENSSISLIRAIQGNGWHTVFTQYSFTENRFTVSVEENFLNTGIEKMEEEMRNRYETIEQVQFQEKEIVLLSDGTLNIGYFIDGNYLYSITGPAKKMDLENVKEVFEVIK